MRQSLISISNILSVYQASMAAQASLCLTWSQTPKIVFFVTRLKWLLLLLLFPISLYYSSYGPGCEDESSNDWCSISHCKCCLFLFIHVFYSVSVVGLTGWAASSEFVSSSIPSCQILTAHAQPFRRARDLAFCLKVLLDTLLVEQRRFWRDQWLVTLRLIPETSIDT